MSPETLSSCENIINKIATELILAAPGSDDGLVPAYALLNELINKIHGQDERWEKACEYIKCALDNLLDNSQPFDQRTLDFVTEFTSWGQDALLKTGNGNDDFEALDKPDWIHTEEDEMESMLEEGDLDEEGSADFSISSCEEVLNQIATELVIASPGSDNGLVPSYSLITEFIEKSAGNKKLLSAAENVKAALGILLDNAQPFSSELIEYLGEFTTWAQTACHGLHQGLQPSRAFEAFEDVNTTGDTSSISQEIPAEDIPQVDLPEEPVTIESTISEAKKTTESAGESSSAVMAQFEVDPNEVATVAKETDVLLDLGSEEDQEILGEFHTESMEHLEQIEAALLVLEKDPENSESLNAIFRSFHTIKGVSGFLHLVPIQSLAHDVESLLDLARNKKITLDSSMITLILQSQDTIQALIDQITLALEKGKMPDEIVPVSNLIVSVRQAAKRGLAIAAGEISADAQVGETQATSSETTNTEKTEASDLPETALELPTEAATEPTPVSPPSGPFAGKPKSRPQTNQSGGGASRSTIRVNTLKLDNLMDMVGELVIVQSQLSESARNETIDDNSPLQRNISQLQRITRELQHTSMSLRLVPIKPTFQKVGRLVRDLASSFNKKVNLIVEGEDTELDRNVVEQIGDPLVHMVRNSLDHGLEKDVQDRIKLGKSEIGNIELKAYHQGSNIVIELRDDGRGIDPQKILSKAKQRGLVAENAEPPKHEILNLIFEPGFSTAEKITDVSGRGVGMDVVRRNIEKLRGKVELSSDVGVGTTFKIKLPLTTAIIDGLVVQVGNDKFILPTTSVKVALRPTQEQISKIKGKAEVLDLRGKTIPLVRLHEIFNIDTEIKEHWDGIVVIIETIGRPYGLLVDEMLNKQEVVIKSLGSLMQGISGVAGGAILGDGTIALILDPFSLVQKN